MKKAVFSGNLQGMVWLARVEHSLKPCTTRRLRSIKQLPEHWRRHGSPVEVTVILHQIDYVVINLSANIQQLQQQCAYSFLPLPQLCHASEILAFVILSQKRKKKIKKKKKIPLLFPQCQTWDPCALEKGQGPAVSRRASWQRRGRAAQLSLQPGILRAFLGRLGTHSAQRHCCERMYPGGRAAFPEHGSFQLGIQRCSQHVRMFTEQLSLLRDYVKMYQCA